MSYYDIFFVDSLATTTTCCYMFWCLYLVVNLAECCKMLSQGTNVELLHTVVQNIEVSDKIRLGKTKDLIGKTQKLHWVYIFMDCLLCLQTVLILTIS